MNGTPGNLQWPHIAEKVGALAAGRDVRHVSILETQGLTGIRSTGGDSLQKDIR